MDALRAFRSAPLGQQLRAVPFALLLLLAQSMLRFTSYRTTRRFLRKSESIRFLRGPSLSPADLSAELTAVGRRPPLSRLGVDCVAESLVLESLLRRRAYEPELRVGVDPADPSDAHTWVELDGLPLNDSPDVYTRLEVFDGGIPHL